MRAPIWGTSPVVDGRVVFGDKSGWMYMLSAKDGRATLGVKIGENINATPAILDGRIYIGAFNGKLFALGPKNGASTLQPPTTNPKSVP